MTLYRLLAELSAPVSLGVIVWTVAKLMGVA